ncbi:hypothetical protein RclHR1_00510012 [Rhizophagus clarus]|uniref:Uncharacterized protein n=1 Tax=Rhizophagus clarus TaxID=94130 RepID=A0A2Z6RMG6_9GLOM|nr:hypothetical protein RclHR1_00510012 [Rhizophagus clarus]
MLPDEKHDQTIGIKCCQTKNTTELLELSVARKDDRLLELRTIEVKSIWSRDYGIPSSVTNHLSKSQSFRTGGFKYHEISMSVK